jgi:hypothetical protein
MQMESAKSTTCGFLTFVLILISIILASDRSAFLFFSDEAKAAPENELELNCDNNEEPCLVEACIGRGCSAVGKGLEISQLHSKDILLGNDPMRIDTKDYCHTSDDEKEEVSNFNFRATHEESDQPSSSNILGKSSQIPSARWDHSGSDILIGMDLGMIKKICSIDVLFNNDAEIQNGYTLTVSDSTTSLHNVVNESATGSLPKSWSSHNFNSLTGRFIQITIPGVSEFYLDDDEDDPVISEINVKALSLNPPSRNSSTQINSTDKIIKQLPNNTIAQHELSPLEFLDTGSDLLNTPALGPEHYGINQSSLTDISSTPTSSMYTGDIFLP